MTKIPMFLAASNLLTGFSCYSGQQPEPAGTVVFWGDFKKGDFIHYYTRKEDFVFYSFSKRIEQDSIYYFEEAVGDFTDFRFNCHRRNGVTYIWFPGDTIEIRVTGKNSYVLKSDDPIRQNELDWQLELDSTGISARHFKGDVETIEKHFSKNMAELERKLTEGEISARFHDVMKCVLTHMYVSQILYPFTMERKVHGNIDVERLFDMFPIDEIQLQRYSYRISLLALAKASVLQEGLPLTKANVLAIANRRFEGKIRDFIPTAFVCNEVIDNVFDYADQELLLESVKDPFYRGLLLEAYKRKFDLDTELTSLAGQSLKLEDVINAGPDTLLYVDFWASWCTPCREEMKHYPELLEKFGDGKVKFLFISLDGDGKSWRIEAKKHAFMNESNSFVFSNLRNNRFVSELNINAIPRYIVFKNGEVLSTNAARPGQLKDFEDFTRESRY